MTSFTTVLNLLVEFFVFKGMFCMNNLALADFVAAISVHVIPHLLQRNPLFRSRFTV